MGVCLYGPERYCSGGEERDSVNACGFQPAEEPSNFVVRGRKLIANRLAFQQQIVLEMLQRCGSSDECIGFMHQADDAYTHGYFPFAAAPFADFSFARFGKYVGHDTLLDALSTNMPSHFPASRVL